MTTASRPCPSCSTPLPGVAAFCYVCGEATPAGLDMRTGERIAVNSSGITAVDLQIRLQHTLGESYKLGERIGAGGFAEVFKARDVRLKRHVAVKVLRPDIGLTPGMLDRFQREAEVIAALRHPNIVPIYDIGHGDGIAYIMMPFVEGHSLRELMEEEGALSVEEAVRILKEAAMGLSVAHSAGVIHRDIKPENIMIEGTDRRVLLMDFGIAKAVGGEDETPATDEGVAPTLTSTGIIVGTPQYMSPEQACGDKSIDARTDQYSLAVVGYRLLSNSLPFEGDSTRSVLYKQLVADPEPLSERVKGLPEEIVNAIDRAMKKEPRERFDDMAAFATALGSGAGSTATVTKPKPRRKGKPKHKKAAKANASRAASAGAALASKLKGLPKLPGFRLPKFAWANTKFLDRIPKERRPLVLGGVGVLLVSVVVAVMVKSMVPGGSIPEDDFTPVSAVGFGGLDSIATAAGVDSATLAAVEAPASTSQQPTAPATGQTRTPPPRARTAVANGGAAVAESTEPTCQELTTGGLWTEALAACSAAATSAGDPVAMRLLGGMYENGTGVNQDLATAFDWYRRASANDGAAAFRLSQMYERGVGTEQDLEANITALRSAARLGHLQATLTLALRLETGGGMDRDEDEAVIWYRRGAAGGSVTAMTKLADMASRGRGMDKDPAAAVDWLRQAGEAGSPVAAWEAAQAYLEGKDVPVDEAVGMRLLRRAVQLGNDDAAEELRKRGG